MTPERAAIIAAILAKVPKLTNVQRERLAELLPVPASKHRARADQRKGGVT